MKRVKTITAKHAVMARYGLRLTVRELAELAGLNKETIVKIEAGRNVEGQSLAAVKKALESKGVNFLIDEKETRIAVSLPLTK